MGVTLKDIWKNYNISTVMLLPLFNDIYKGIKSTGKSNVEYTFLQLCFEYGLINTYLHTEGKTHYLILKFDVNEVNQNNNLTASKYYSFNDLIIDSKEFTYVRNINDKEVLYYLKIPAKFSKDIELIRQSKYSETSDEFKNAIRVKGEKIPKTSNEIGVFIAASNLGFSICMKHKFIKQFVEDLVGRQLDENMELYTAYDPDKETLNGEESILQTSRDDIVETSGV